MATSCFLAEEVGVRAWLRIYWGDYKAEHHHNAWRLLGDTFQRADWSAFGQAPDHPDAAEWPTHCEACGAPVPEGHFLATSHVVGEFSPVYQVFHNRLYRANGGLFQEPDRGPGPKADKLPPGALFYADWMDYEGRCTFWDNCDGRHLVAVLPNRRTWDIDSRASNCTLKDDRMHRCWVRVGEPPRTTVGKGGPTCSAGAGSILAGDYHGFLQNGVLT